MQNVICSPERKAELKDKLADNQLEPKHLHDVTTLASELKSLLVRHNSILKEGGVRKEMQQLEEWLEQERKGPAPACIISESGITWLTALRDRLKLTADEAVRMEGEGGPNATKEQVEKTEDLLKTVRRIDQIINDCSPCAAH